MKKSRLELMRNAHWRASEALSMMGAILKELEDEAGPCRHDWMSLRDPHDHTISWRCRECGHESTMRPV